ncbi:MAG: hypothetical protein AAGJ97_03100 [Planctomycetota bacterium]
MTGPRWRPLPLTAPGENPLVTQTEAATRSLTLLRTFTAVNLLFAVYHVFYADKADGTGSWWPAETPQFWDPVWCVTWVDLVGVAVGFPLIYLGNIAAAFAAAVWPGSRPLRVAAAVTQFLAVALFSSYGKIEHLWHMWVWAAIGLSFAPTIKADVAAEPRAKRQLLIETVWMTQALILLFYTLSGVIKAAFVPVQLALGQPHLFSVDALARHVADRLHQTGATAPLGELVVEHPWLGFPAFQAGMYLELASLLVAFRPACHRLWGAALIGLHVSIGLTMTIWFLPNVVLLAILFLNSPFAPPDRGFWDGWRDLPGLLWLTRRRD